MGDYTHAERTYLFAYLSESGIYRNINEWCSKGVTPQIDNLQSVSYTDMPVWHETFLAGGMIIIPELSAVRQTMRGGRRRPKAGCGKLRCARWTRCPVR